MTQSPPPAPVWFVRIAMGALAVWLGGLVFYATLVIPAGADVLGGHTAFGFVTREVTNRLNLLGTGVLIVLLGGQLAWRESTPRSLWIASGIMTVCQVALFFLHPWLEELLQIEERAVRDMDRFYSRHQIYLWTTMVQWLAGAFYGYVLLGRSMPTRGSPRDLA